MANFQAWGESSGLRARATVRVSHVFDGRWYEDSPTYKANTTLKEQYFAVGTVHWK
jgi:hypothetical protein